MPPQQSENSQNDPASLLAVARDLVDSLYAQSRASEWQLSRDKFTAALERSLRKRFESGGLSRLRLEEYLNTLHVEDLALASACMQGSDSAWNHFVREHRGYLRAAAGVICKGSRAGTDAQELADSLFAELFGLADGKRGEQSLFRYFHGRSSLKTWLRTLLAQRHIDQLRASKRFESLEQENGDGETKLPAEPVTFPLLDPHRNRYIACFDAALRACLTAIAPQDLQRLQLYYVQQKTLAEIGRTLGEHESSASRNLERVRTELRVAVESHLREIALLSPAEIALCSQYAAEAGTLDFRTLFPGAGSSSKEISAGTAPEKNPGTGRKESP